MISKALILILGFFQLAINCQKINFELYITPFFPLTMCIPGTEQIIDNGVYLAS
jgi:hypothetical protein